MMYRWEVYHRMEPARLLATEVAATADEAIRQYLDARHGRGDHSGLGSALSASRMPFSDVEAVQRFSDTVHMLPSGSEVTLRIVRARNGTIVMDTVPKSDR